MEQEFVPLIGWGSPATFERQVELAFVNRNYAARTTILSDRQERFGDLRAQMNLDELGDAIYRDARQRTALEIEKLDQDRMPVDGAALNKLVGNYVPKNGNPIAIFTQEGSHHFKLASGYVDELVPTQKDRFLVRRHREYEYVFRDSDPPQFDLRNGQLWRTLMRRD
jgi:hypothetical protein